MRKIIFFVILIISFFYIFVRNKGMKRENFKLSNRNFTPSLTKAISNMSSNHSIGPVKSIYKPESANRFCNDLRPLDKNPSILKCNQPQPNPNGVFNNPNYVSINQRLAGKANPKTLIKPVITPPCVALDYWKTNNLVTFSQINNDREIDLYNSGYITMSCCPNTTNPIIATPAEPRSALEERSATIHAAHAATPLADRRSARNFVPLKETFEFPYVKEQETRFFDNQGLVNTSCGYNPSQIKNGLPVNLAAGNCENTPEMRQYNENLFTQTIQPGVYVKNQVNEPINANIGISFTQQIPPTTCSAVDKYGGEVIYTEHNPIDYKPQKQEKVRNLSPSESNVYDPRFSGYGTSYRSYTDPLLGQPKFYYDDVDAIRMPNYICRNNIDNQPFADHYGSFNEKGNSNHSNIRALANNAFLDSALTFRTGLQQSLMRKINAESWQQRKSPISTSGQRMLGGSRIF